MNSFDMTEAEFAILSLVAEKPVYGYEIEQIIKGRGMREWTAVGFSSIYFLLNKLEAKEWIGSKKSIIPSSGLKRRIYSITKKGMKCCEQNTIRALSEPRANSNVFLIGLSNLPLLNHGQIITALSEYKDTLARKKQELVEKMERQGFSLPLNASAIFDHSITMIQSEIEWIDHFILRMRFSLTSGGK